MSEPVSIIVLCDGCGDTMNATWSKRSGIMLVKPCERCCKKEPAKPSIPEPIAQAFETLQAPPPFTRKPME